jgi:hypothetical protein
MKRTSSISCGLILVAGALLTGAPAQSTPPPQPVPSIDGGLGACSLELTVTADGRPAAAASVKVHIAYRFGGFHKLDLEAGTNVDGKVKFTGLPSSVRRPPMEFHASKDQLVGTATFDPATECQAKRDIALGKPKPSEQ